MTAETSAPLPGMLYPIDFEVAIKLLARANIVVGDVPNIIGTLQRLEAAAKSGNSFSEVRPAANDGEA